MINQEFFALNSSQRFKRRGNEFEDFADRINSKLTVILLWLAAIIVGVRQYYFKPISCYISTVVSGDNLREYVENYCWVSGTIPFAPNAQLPETVTEWEQYEQLKIDVYQWIPVILGVQCVAFYLPRILWQAYCYNMSGNSLGPLMNLGTRAVQSSDKEERERLAVQLADNLFQMLQFQKAERAGATTTSTTSTAIDLEAAQQQPSGHRSHRSRLHVHRPPQPRLLMATLARRHTDCASRVLALKRRFNRVYLFYMFIKLLYLVNSTVQIVVIDRKLGVQSSGILNILKKLFVGAKNIYFFPRVTHCFVPVRAVGAAKNALSAQCVLPVNMLNEQVFTFLFFWIIIVLVVNFVYLVVWAVRIGKGDANHGFLSKYLNLDSAFGQCDRSMNYQTKVCLFKRFETKFFRRDGMFLLQMIAINTDHLFMARVIGALWRKFKLEKGVATLHCKSKSDSVLPSHTQFSPPPPPPHSRALPTHQPEDAADSTPPAIMTEPSAPPPLSPSLTPSSEFSKRYYPPPQPQPPPPTQQSQQTQQAKQPALSAIKPNDNNKNNAGDEAEANLLAAVKKS